jgi:hypothetical protein
MTLRPPDLIEWRCTDRQHPAAQGFADLKDWIGTSIRFAIEPLDGERSRLRFAPRPPFMSTGRR